jgi:hypothetical protein
MAELKLRACGVPAAQLLVVDGRKAAIRELGARLGYLRTNRPGEHVNTPDRDAFDKPIATARSILFAHDARVWTEEKSVALDILLIATIGMDEP